MANDGSVTEPIAVVGVGCRFPGGADSPEALWDVLSGGLDCMGPVPAERWDERRFYDANPDAVGKHRIRQAGFLRGSIYEFDAPFFGFSPREAEVLDPRQWLTLESAWEAFEDAAIRPASLAGSDTAVFVSSFLEDSTIHRMDPLALANLDGHVSRASSQTMLAARLSHFFDLRGPSLALDTACSGSLVATHLGCQSIWRGECSLALVGGVNLILRPEPMVVLDKGGFLSTGARCRTFDARASGYARGEGAAVVVLEPLSRARAAGRRIYALICASSCNQDGHTPGITVPNVQAQIQLVRGLCDRAGVAPSAVDFVEAHGTGTPVGDPVEVQALQAVLAPGRPPGRPCWVGSIKTNIGHLEAAAGVAGLIKACLCLAHRRVAPAIHFERLNPAIDLSSGALAIATASVDLAGPGPWHAVVNSFGYGGTNAALLLRSAPEVPAPEPCEEPGPAVVPVAARSDGSLRALAARYADWVCRQPACSPHLLARAVHQTRDAHRYRAAVVAGSASELADRLRRLAADERDPGLFVAKVDGEPEAPVFAFTGMGAQSWGMGEDLLERDPVARRALAECAEVFGDLTGRRLLDRFDPGSPTRRTHPTGSPMVRPTDAQPANLALQVVLTRTWRAQGLEPGAVVGHSVGEIAAAWAAGVLSLEHAFLVIATRAELLSRLEGRGTMLAVHGEVQRLLPLLQRPDLDVCVGTVNGPRLCVASGPRAGLEALVPVLEQRGARCTFLPLAVPYHHPSILPFADEFRERTATVASGEPRCPFYSTATGGRMVAIPLGHEHWWRACVAPSRLDLAVEALREDGRQVYVEVGPHPNIGPTIAESYLEVGARAAVVPSLRRGVPALEALAWLWVRGLWAPAPVPPGPSLRLPRYAWERERHCAMTEGTRRYLFGTNEHPLLQLREIGPALAWRSELRTPFLPFLPDHRLVGLEVFPGVGYLEAALAAARALHEAPFEVEHLQLHNMLVTLERPLAHISVDQDGGLFVFASAATSDETSWLTHATARLVRGGGSIPEDAVDLLALRGRCPTAIEPEIFYGDIERAGLGYGPAFRSIRSLRRGAGEVLAELSTDADTAGYLAHPGLLDGAVQVFFALREDAGNAIPLVPVAIQRVRLRAPLGSRVWVWARLQANGPDHALGRILVADADGRVLLELDGVRCRRVRVEDVLDRATLLYHHVWERTEPPGAAAAPPTRWHLLEQREGGAQALAQALVARGCRVEVLPLELAGPPEMPGEAAVAVVLESELPTDPQAVPLGGHGWLPSKGDEEGTFLSALVALTRALCGSRSPRHLALLTDRAFRVVAADPAVDPAQRAAWGLLRAVANEVPALRCARIDRRCATAGGLADELLAETAEDEVALREEGRFVHRLVRTRGTERGLPIHLPSDTPMCLRASPASVGGVEFVEGEPVAPGPDEVRCRVWLAGLNFKDVLKAQRRLPDEYLERTYSGRGLGSEFVGEVVEVGAEVRGLAAGDVVYGFANDALGTCLNRRLTAVVDGQRVWAPTIFPVPSARAPEDFVGLVNFVTAWHCLVSLARIRRGETVLIHSAAGGVGLAALQIARMHGARALATAGTDEKRSYLASLGVELVCDSRGLGFADRALAWTHGRGVDVVLGSAPGEAVARSLRILAPFGRYVDIGKADILRGARLGLAALDGNRSFTAFDLDLAEGEPALYQSVLAVVAAQASGDLRPLPLRVFPASRAEEAVRYLGRGGHIGKVAIDMRGGPIPAVRRHPCARAGEGTVLVVGGLGRLGLALARWLVARGERHLALVGRSGAADLGTLDALERLRGRAEVLVFAADATDRASMAALLGTLRSSGRPLHGVYHLAAVWEDQLLATQSDASFARVYNSKVRAATLLHDLTLGDPLAEFVLFSSVSALLGNPGQAAYSAANAYLDGLAHLRRAHGLPALAVDLGLIGDVGVAAGDAELTRLLESRGLVALAFTEALERLGRLLEDRPIQCAIAGFDWERVQRAWRLAPRFERLLAANTARPTAGASMAVRAASLALRQATPANRERSAVRLMVQVVSDLLGVDPERLDPDLSLMDMGLDSLMAVEFGALISDATGVRINPELITSGASLRECARAIAEAVAAQA
jgi:acyl transferase domain-containing protein/acyl carrier protein